MIFDKNTIEKNCEEFYSLYNITEDKVYDMCRLKLIHTRAVAENCLKIAKDMELNDYDTTLAWIIGELHDFARFGQAVVTHSLDDSEKFNHARLGARILFTHGLIEDIIPNYYEISEEDRLVMEKAVYHHSDFKLPDDLTSRERLFCDIIREADQLDIFRTIVESGWELIYDAGKDEIEASAISEEIEAAFYTRTLADYSKRKTPADFHLGHIALCFGLESPAARKRAVDQGYLEQMMDITFKEPSVQERYIKIKDSVHEYLGNS